MALAGVDVGTVPCTAASHEVGDGADRRGRAELGRLMWEEGREEEKGWVAAAGQEEGEEENEPMRLFLFPISFSISYLYMHMFK